MDTARDILEDRLRTAAARLGVAGDRVRVGAASDRRFGDYQSNIAMALAKERGRKPREIAAEIVAAFDGSGLCSQPEIAGAGFINFTLDPAFLASRLAALCGDSRLGVPVPPRPLSIVIDFSAPNIAKPMHVGHIRSTILGDALARVARFLGHRVVTDNHVGDWGTQFGKVIYGWKHFRDDGALAREPVEELVRLYKRAHDLSERDPAILDACRRELAALQSGDPVNRDIWSRCVELSRAEFDSIYRALDIHFDVWLGESHYNDRLAELVDRLLQRGVARVSDGAACVFFPDLPDLAETPCLIRKSDGAFLYATTDLATIEYRVARWQPDEIWYVTGAPQQLHFRQVFEAARRMGVEGVTLRHIPFGSILGEDRKLMKTRSGDNVSLRDLLDEAVERAAALVAEKNPALDAQERAAIARTVGIGAVKYAELSQFRMTDYVFAWDRMLSFQGNTAPYLQNAYVRIRSIFRKGGEPAADPAAAGPMTLDDPAERALALRLLQFAEVVPEVLDDFRPNLLANYLYDLAIGFHGFYETCPVLKAAEPARSTRLALCGQTARVLQCGLGLLGIDAPERM